MFVQLSRQTRLKHHYYAQSGHVLRMIYETLIMPSGDSSRKGIIETRTDEIRPKTVRVSQLSDRSMRSNRTE